MPAYASSTQRAAKENGSCEQQGSRTVAHTKKMFGRCALLLVKIFGEISSCFATRKRPSRAAWLRVHVYKVTRPSECEPRRSIAVPAESQDDLVLEPLIPRLTIYGNCGLRTWYSDFCGKMATNGFFVLRIEHRDGSNARSCLDLHITRD
ncbi:hypothetical protein F4823DRAFT_373834 [Ustulina deusta]|nr:hypothetical protein F4823DRAFT_373834 [Ustulina deusta]